MSRRLRATCVGIAAVTLWITLLRFPNLVPGVTLDDSWMAAFAYFLKRGLQAGVDYVYTYGPLGFFMLRAYDADLFAARLVWELGLKAIFTLIAFWFLFRQRGTIARGLFYAALLAFPAAGDDAMYTLMIVLLGVLTITAPDAPLWRIGGVGLLLAILVMLKISLFLIGCTVALSVVMHFVAGGRAKAALVAAGSFVVAFAALWTMVGQSPSSFPVFVRSATEISSGFSEAQALEGDPIEVAAGVAVLALLASTWIPSRGWRFDGCAGALNALVLGAATFLFWKQGFVRHDEHPLGFFALTLPMSFVPPVAIVKSPWPPRWRGLLLLSAGLVSAFGLVKVTHAAGPDRWPDPWRNVSDGIHGVFAPGTLWQRLAAEDIALRARFDLPRLRAILGGEPMDVLGNYQGIALLNRLNWRPRPTFQSYLAYTDWLAERNVAFFDGPLAPRYVLLGGSPIDGRFPTTEDGPVLLRILAGYRPIAAERGFLLLKKDPTAPTSAADTARSSLRLGEALRLPPTDRPEVLRLRIRKSLWGEIRGFLFHLPPVELTVLTEEGTTGTFRVLPSLRRTGFLLNPLLLGPADWIDVYAGHGGEPRIIAFRVDAPTGRNCFSTVDVEVDTLSALTSIRIDPIAASALRAQLGE